jgi:acetylornithine deacetylase/succinyl-diaminopimelate desuccinylase-like protein
LLCLRIQTIYKELLMTALEYLAQTERQRFDELSKFISFPSVSGQPERKGDVAACAEWLKNHLAAIGLKAQLMPTGGHPVVYAEYIVGPHVPTILYYGHYDVQPPEPFELWTTPPFEAQIRDGYIYARGSSDDKGQTFTHIKGIEAIIKSTATLPVNVKMLIEGEEESHSANLPTFLKTNKDLLKADIVVVSDTGQFSENQPAVTYGLRGIASCEVFVDGPDRDVHSGAFGGSIANPINTLCWMVAQLHDKKGKVAIPGFYVGVKPPSKWERTQFKKLPFKESAYKKMLGVPALHGEKGFTVFEQVWSRPTLDVNGFTGGYQGDGAKTIIAAKASCKITMRLVPGQKPMDICNKLEKFLKKIAPKGVKVRVDKHGGARAVAVPIEGPWLDAASRAVQAGFGKKPVFIKEGGSIPVTVEFKETLGLDTLLIGFGLASDNIHSPNERFRVIDFERGCKTAAFLPFELAKVKA